MASLPKLVNDLETGIEKIEQRPFDRFALGPFMIWYGLQSKKMGKWPRRAMVAGGIFQLLYAWREYRKLMGAVKEPDKFMDILKNEGE